MLGAFYIHAISALEGPEYTNLMTKTGNDFRSHRRQPRLLPRSSGRSGREEMIARSGERRATVSSLSRRKKRKYGAVETRAGSASAAPTCSSKHRDEIDGIIVTLPNFGDERAIADTLRMADLNVPVLIQATPDTPGKMTIATGATASAARCRPATTCTQYGIPYSLTTLHTEAPDSDRFRKDLAWFAAVCRVVSGLRSLRIGAIGARPAAFNTVRYSEKLLEANGISVEPIDLSEILGRIERMKDDDPAAQAKLAAINGYVIHAGHSRSCADEDGEARRRDRRWMAATRRGHQRRPVLDLAGRILRRCACTVMSMMSNEPDVQRLRSGHRGRHRHACAAAGIGTPSALLDWNNNYGDDPDKAVCFHCSNLPEALLRGRADGFPGDHRRHCGQGKYVRNLRGPREGGSDELTRASRQTT